MLTKESETILVNLINVDPNMQGRFITTNHAFDRLAHCGIDDTRFLAILDLLSTDGYIQFDDSQQTVFHITERGIAYDQIKNADISAKRRNDIRYWITTGIAAGGLLLAIIALISK